MKKLILPILIAASAASSAFASDQQINVKCGDFNAIVKVLTEQYKELPNTIMANSERETKYVFMTNTKTNTWTYLAVKDDVACVLATGDKLIYIGTH